VLCVCSQICSNAEVRSSYAWRWRSAQYVGSRGKCDPANVFPLLLLTLLSVLLLLLLLLLLCAG
jgi:hypothetical protein